MAFNVGKFVKSAAKNVANRVLDDVVSSATSKLPNSLQSTARSTADSLFNVGASFESVSAFATQRTDSIINQGGDIFFALAGKDPARAAAVDIAKRRRGNTEDLSTFVEEVNPSTKIAMKKREQAAAIIDAVI